MSKNLEKVVENIFLQRFIYVTALHKVKNDIMMIFDSRKIFIILNSGLIK